MWIESLVTAAVCLILLLATIPTSGWQLFRRNCVRLDGSYSASRFRRELAAIREHVLTTALPVLLSGLVFFATLTVVFTFIAPFDTILEAFSRFDSDFGSWRNDLQSVRQQHSRFLTGIGFKRETAQQLQKTLWEAWPLLALLAAGSLFLTLRSFVACGRRSAVHLLEGARHRRSLYAAGDVARMRSADSRSAISG